MESEKKVLVIASAGGHLTQALCATSRCENLILISNKKNVSDAKIKKFYKIMDTQHNPIIHFLNIFFALFILVKERPSVIFSTGGPIVLPFALLSRLVRIKFVFLDTLSRVTELSNTGKLIKKYNLYDAFYSQWENMAKKNEVGYIGKCFDILGENHYAFVRKAKQPPPLILVTVGTCQYNFDRLFNLIAKHPLYSDNRVEWIIQASHNKIATLPANGKILELVSRDEMEQLVKRSSLVISHCGIGSINLMLSYQKEVIFVPRVARLNEFSDDHQLQIANEISSKYFDVIAPDSDLPNITFDDLMKKQLLEEPVDITNHKMAEMLKSSFYK